MSEVKELLVPVGEWIFVKIEKEQTTKSGIVLVGSKNERVCDAVIVDVGPDAFSADGPVKSAQFGAGDRVKVQMNLVAVMDEKREVYNCKSNAIVGRLVVEDEV